MKKTRGPNKTYKVKESERARVLTDEFVQNVIGHRDKKTKELDPIEGIEKYTKDYGHGLFELKDAEFAYALIYLRKAVAETGNEALVISYGEGDSDIRQDIKLLIAKGVLTSSALAAVHHKDILVQALSGPLDLRIKYGLSFVYKSVPEKEKPEVEKATISRESHSAITEENGRGFFKRKLYNRFRSAR